MVNHIGMGLVSWLDVNKSMYGHTFKLWYTMTLWYHSYNWVIECHDTSGVSEICAKFSLDFGTSTPKYPLNDQNAKKNLCKYYENDPKPPFLSEAWSMTKTA